MIQGEQSTTRPLVIAGKDSQLCAALSLRLSSISLGSTRSALILVLVTVPLFECDQIPHSGQCARSTASILGVYLF